MAQSRRTVNRSLLTTAATVALLALPIAAPVAYSFDDVAGLGVPVGPDGEADPLPGELDELADPLAEAIGETFGAEATPSPGESDMAPAGGDYAPVHEPERAAPAAAPAPAPAASEPAAPAERTSGPALQRGWLSRTMMAFDPVQAPLVAGPMMVPAPQFASPAALGALAGMAADGWAATPGFAVSHRSATPAPAQWPLPVAAGTFFLLAGAAAVWVYDQRWKAATAKHPFSTRL